jgi:hypothetical protein
MTRTVKPADVDAQALGMLVLALSVGPSSQSRLLPCSLAVVHVCMTAELISIGWQLAI